MHLSKNKDQVLAEFKRKWACAVVVSLFCENMATKAKLENKRRVLYGPKQPTVVLTWLVARLLAELMRGCNIQVTFANCLALVEAQVTLIQTHKAVNSLLALLRRLLVATSASLSTYQGNHRSESTRVRATYPNYILYMQPLCSFPFVPNSRPSSEPKLNASLLHLPT